MRIQKVGLTLSLARITPSLAAFILICVSGGRLIAQGPEDTNLQSMMSHGLLDAALRYIQARSHIERNSDANAWWAMREMECQAQLALNRQTKSSDPWRACREVADQYRQSHVESGDVNTNARWPWIQWQMARCNLLEAQSQLAKCLASPGNPSHREAALELVRSVVQQVAELESDIRRRQPLAARQNPSADKQSAIGEAPSEQLRNLAADTQLLHGEALMIRSQLYPEGSSDRSGALTQARSLVTDVLGRTGDEWPLRPAMELVQAAADLELGDEAALEKLERLALSADDSQVRMMAGARAAREFARRGQENRAAMALETLQHLVNRDANLAPHWILTRIEVALTGLERQDEQTRVSTLKDLAELSKQLGDRYGDYWRTRAEALLVGKLSSQGTSDSRLAMDLLLAEVRQLVAAEKIDEAVRKLLLARDLKVQNGDGVSAVDLASKAAALLRHVRKWDDAALEAQSTSIRFAQVDGASEVHLWSIRSYAESMRSQPDDKKRLEAYEKCLSEHLRHWPDDAATGQIVQWLNQWYVGRSKRTQLVELFAEYLPRTTQIDSANRLLSEWFEQVMLLPLSQRSRLLALWQNSKIPFANKDFASAFQAGVQAGQSLSDGVGTAAWSEPETLQVRANSFKHWLTQASSEQFAIRDAIAVANVIEALRLGSLGEPKLEGLPQPAAKAIKFGQLSFPLRAAIIPALADALDSLDNSSRRDVWRQLDLPHDWTSIDVVDLPPSVQSAIARVSIWLGSNGAIERLKQLADTNPNDGPIQLLVAYYWLDHGDAVAALRLATKVAAFSKDDSSLHLAARWCMMRSQVQTGHAADAKSAAELVLATHGDMGQWWERRFRQIAQRP